MSESLKYVGFWNRYLPVIRIKLKEAFNKNEASQLSLSKYDFEVAGGKMKSPYTFSLELVAGKFTNSIACTDVARNLYQVLTEDTTVKAWLMDKSIKINMSAKFVLNFSKME